MTHTIRKIFLITITLLLSVSYTFSQTDKETVINDQEKAIYDSLTYYYYNIGEWDSVIDIGKEALYKGYDFYYLRMRLGLAYDNQKNYRLAEKQYEGALNIIPTDVNAAYYKFYSAINGGRKNVAYKDFINYNTAQAKSINKEQNEKLKYLYEDHRSTTVHNLKIKTFDQVYFAYGYSFTGNKDKLSTLFPKQDDIQYTEGNIRNNQSYLSISLKGNISAKARWSLAYNNSNIRADKLLQTNSEPFLTIPITVKQNELFMGIDLYSGTGWNLKLSGQLLHYNSNLVTISNDTTLYSLPETQDTMLTENDFYNYTDILIKANDYVVGLSLNRKIGLFDVSVFGSYASILDKNPLQLGGELTILPRGNYSLYLTNRLFFYHDKSVNKFIYKVTAGAQLTKKINFEAAATFGDLQFTNEPGLPVVYNWSEKTSFKGDAVFTYHIVNQLYLSLRYQLTQKQSQFNYYPVKEILPSEEYPGYYYKEYGEEEGFYKFNQHFIILGLIWGF